MILPYILTDGDPQPVIDVDVDYDSSAPYNTPDITGADPTSAAWNSATWDLPEEVPPDPVTPIIVATTGWAAPRTGSTGPASAR